LHIYLLLAGKRGGGTSPFPCGGFVSRPVGFIDVCDFRDEGVVGVGVGEHAADGKKDLLKGLQGGGTFGDCEGGGPLVAENVETDATIGVDVWVIDSSGKIHLMLMKLRRRGCTFGGLKG
jgi:hypothetical protein